MKYLLAMIMAVSLTGCTVYSQLFQIESSLKRDSKKLLVFENDTVIVKYYFWAEEGKLSFSVYNKLNKPLYIDWKKSSYVRNNSKVDYWVDQENYTAVSNTVYIPAVWSILGVPASSSITSGTTIKPERVTFLTPHSAYVKASFVLYGEKELVLPKRTPVTTFNSAYNPKNTVNGYVVEFTKANTPLDFRNFLSISTSEKFESETYIDNEFYVSKVTEMPVGELLGELDFETHVYHSEYENPASFYVVPIQEPVKERAKWGN